MEMEVGKVMAKKKHKPDTWTEEDELLNK